MEPTYIDFLDGLLRDDMDSKQRKRIAMGVQFAHFQRLVRELATCGFVANAENALLLGP